MGDGKGLDAAEDAELTILRARAYGPDAAGSLGPVEAARLAELEAADRSSPPVGGRPGPDAAGPIDPAALTTGGGATPAGSGTANTTTPRPATHGVSGGRGIRDGTRTIAVAVVAVVGLVLAGAAAVRTAVEASPVAVARLAAEPGSDGFLVGGASYPPPLFPIAEDMQWSAPLGTVLGWDVWVGRSRSNFACLAVVRAQTVRADCVSASDFTESGVSIYLPPGSIATDLRPAELVGTAAVAYRWSPDRSVTVQVER